MSVPAFTGRGRKTALLSLLYLLSLPGLVLLELLGLIALLLHHVRLYRNLLDGAIHLAQWPPDRLGLF